MDKTRRGPAQIGVMVLFALSCFGLLLFLWLSFGGASPLKPKGYRVAIPMQEAFGLGQVSDVRISGVPVGQVSAVGREGDHTRVEIEIDDRYAPLPSDTRATLRRKTLLGEAYVELTPGDRSGPALPENGSLPEAQVRPSVEVDEVLGAFDEETRRDTRVWLQGWARGLRDRGRDVNDLVGHLPGALEAGDDVLSVLRSQRRATETIVRDTGRAFGVFGRRDARVRELITSGERVFSATAEREDDLRATVRELPPFLGALRGTLASAQRLSGPLLPVVRDLRPGARLLRPTLTRAAAVTPDLEALAGDLDDVTGVAPRGLRATRSVLDALDPLFAQVYPLGRQLAPVVDFAELYKLELANSWPKVGPAVQARSKDLSGRMTHYLRATAVFSNETLALPKTRQPYTRPSTYAAPGGVRSIEQGVLKAWDCSHVDNAQTVPPLGPFPDCIEQDPITFQGRTSQFPEVRPAP